MTLSRLWHQQGERYKARQLLADIDGRCTKGLHTADLQKAQVRLEALA
jgi:hypothetical protein